jgi:hypothetical protein
MFSILLTEVLHERLGSFFTILSIVPCHSNTGFCFWLNFWLELSSDKTLTGFV